MSYLREIMGRLRERAAAPAGEPRPGPAGPSSLQDHLQTYRGNLQACSDAMLRYEWAWLADHLSTLQLSVGHAEMRQAFGGREQVDTLLREFEAFREQLQREMNQRGVEPSSRTAPLASMEHAWELSCASIREQWGMEPDPLRSSDPPGVRTE